MVRLKIITDFYAVSMISHFAVSFLAPSVLGHWLSSIQSSFNLSDLILLLIAPVLAKVFHEGLCIREVAALTV